MKNFLVFALMLVSQAAGAAEQGFNPEILYSSLSVVAIDAGHTNLQGVSYGEVSVDLGQRLITAKLYRPYPCQPNRACPAVMVPVVIQLEITSIYNDRCGSQYYVARHDLRPVDGNLASLEVVDHTLNRCPHLRPLGATTMTYETAGYNRMEGTEHHAVSTFRGTPLLAADVDPSAL